MTHPHELLAEYVDGALDASARAEVEAHLSSCEVCRAEVADATSARHTLRGLPELEEPPGITMAVLRQARETRAAPRRRAPLRVAAALVLLAGAAAGAIYVYGQVGQDGEDASPAAEAPGPRSGPDAETEEEASEDRGAADGQAALSGVSYPQVRRTGAAHDPDSIVALAEELRDEARDRLEAAFPPDAFSFYETFPVDSFAPAARAALVCAGQGLEPDRSVVPFVIEEASWAGEPAWVVSYFQGPEPSAGYDRVQILVVHREECTLLHFAQQRL